MSELDRALAVWADVVERATKIDRRAAAGAGAAGGVGFAAQAVLGACAAVTGEGSLDHQSLRGKAAVGVCRRAGAHGIPTYAVAGVSALAPVEAKTAGLAGVYALSDLEPDRQRSISRAGELLALATERLTRELLRAGAVQDWRCRSVGAGRSSQVRLTNVGDK